MGRFDSLPKEIVFEIFSRLPVDSVLDCKLVCKPWRDAVRHPLFSQVHLDYQLQFGKFSFLFSVGRIQEHYYAEYDDIDEETLVGRETRIQLDDPPLKNYHFIKHEILQNSYLVGSCNGLLCFNRILEGECSRHYGPTCIFNPVSREYIMLPESKGYSMGGFGYSASTNEYKVVRVHDFVKDSNAPLLQVYTLGSGNGWRNVGKMDMSMKQFFPFTRGQFADGALYWLNCEGTNFLAFHLADEKFTELSAPPPFLTARTPCSYSLMALGDFLIATYSEGHCEELWLRKKNKDNFGWNKELSLDIELYWCPIGFTKSGRLLSWEERSGFCSYDTKASSAKMFVSGGLDWGLVSQPVHHKNTFVSLKVLGERDTRTMEFGERASSSKEAENSTDKPEEAAK